MKKKLNLSKSIRKIWNLDPWKILYGMLSNWGLVLVSIIASICLTLVIDTKLAGNLIPLMYFFFSLVFYFPIRKLKEYRLGYIIAFILGETFVLKIYCLLN